MDYNKIYNDLIQKRIENPLERKGDASIEEHHIIPRSFGGTNEKTNLVNLTLREHFVAHLLLLKMNESDSVKMGKMASAIFSMMNRTYKVSSRLYEALRKKGGSWFGRHHTKEQREKTRHTMTKNGITGKRTWLNKNGVVKYVLNGKVNQFLEDGWEYGRPGYKPRKGMHGKTILMDGSQNGNTPD